MGTRTPYRECPRCGAHIDAGEICDCHRERDAEDREAPAPSAGPRMKLIAVCREVNKYTGQVAVYKIEKEITGEDVRNPGEAEPGIALFHDDFRPLGAVRGSNRGDIAAADGHGGGRGPNRRNR